jgi:hypothetical protein
MALVSLYLVTPGIPPLTKFWLFSLDAASCIFFILSFDALIMFISLGSLAIALCYFLITSSYEQFTWIETSLRPNNVYSAWHVLPSTSNGLTFESITSNVFMVQSDASSTRFSLYVGSR